MGNSTLPPTKYTLKAIFYGNVPRNVTRIIQTNNEIRRTTYITNNANNEYFLYKKYMWYMYLTLNHHNISNINDITNIIENGPPSTRNPRKIFKKNVILCFSPKQESINLLQHYQKEFFRNNNIEDDMPYFIFNQSSLIPNNQNMWNIEILFSEEKEIINISVVSENLQIYQSDFYYEDFLKCRLFRNYNSLNDIYIRLRQLIERNEYDIQINKNTEKLEILVSFNQQPNNIGGLDDSIKSISTIDSEHNGKKYMKKIKTPLKNSKKFVELKSRQKNSSTKIFADDYDALLIVEQNVFIHVSFKNLLESERAYANALLDAANYYNYLPLIIDENKISYNSFNIMTIGKSQSGKSILMNKIAGQNITHSTQGTLRTEDIFMRDILNGKINLYDTCGANNSNSPNSIYTKLENKIGCLKQNGEKIDLLLIVIKKGDMPDKIVFTDLIIKLIQLNLNYLIVINYYEKIINSIRNIVKEAFLENGCQIDDSNIVDVNIMRDITPLYKKIFEKFSFSRITSQTFQNENLSNINNLSNYSRRHELLLYKDISFDDIFKRKNWEAEKLFSKYLMAIIGTNFIPFANIIMPLILTLKFISSLHNIYFGHPLFNSRFFESLNHIGNLSNEQRNNLIRNLSVKTGLRLFVHLGAGFGTKVIIKMSTDFLLVFPAIGIIASALIGDLIDIPTFKSDYNLAKNEFMERLKSRPNNLINKIVNDYNEAINYFGRKADININHDNYKIRIEEELIHLIDDELEELLN